MSVWVIRQKSTGFYLPEIGPKTGYSFTAPTDKKPPRLFISEANAKGSMQAWLRGRHKAVYDRDFGVVGTKIEHDPARDPKDFEVVELDLVPHVEHDPRCRGCGCHT